MSGGVDDVNKAEETVRSSKRNLVRVVGNVQRNGPPGSVWGGEDLCGLLLVAPVALVETDLSGFSRKEQSVEGLTITDLAKTLVLS